MERRRLLIVDDDPDIRRLSAAVLEGAGFEVTTQPSGVEALRWLDTVATLPDLVVLDVQMPHMDGWTVLERVRSDVRLRSVPVLLCTVRDSDAAHDLARRYGASAYLPKPFSIDALTDAVRCLC